MSGGDPDTLNRFMVSADGGGNIIVLNPPLGPISRAHALNLAAWLVAMADPDAAVHVRTGPLANGAEFVALLRAVVNT